MAINPKEVFGDRKVPMSYVSVPVMMEVGLGMMEGGIKYGPFNYRETPINYSTYYNALWRHMGAFWEGEDIDSLSGLSHVTKAICSLTVLRDSMIHGTAVDDRPPPSHPEWMEKLNKKTEEMRKRLCTIGQNPTPSEPSGSHQTE